MLYTRDIQATITITDVETGEKVESRERRTLRNSRLSMNEAKAAFKRSAENRASGEYGIEKARVTVSGVKEQLFDASH